MEPTIRHARDSDHDAIAAFTTATFEWGDYVADVFPDWLADPTGCVMVAVDDEDTPVAVGRGIMLSETELWLQGARVNELWRRRGLASAVAEAIAAWGREQGALVARLGTEDWNTAAQRQVEKVGFRPVGDWVVAVRPTPAAEPATSANGGKRARARRKLERAHSTEATPAWISWRSGPLVQPARELHSWHWRWSRLEFDYLVGGAKNGELLSSPAGWAYARVDKERLLIGWLECGPDDADQMIRAIVDLAQDAGAERIHLPVPAVDWLVEALETAQFELHPMVIYERAL